MDIMDGAISVKDPAVKDLTVIELINLNVIRFADNIAIAWLNEKINYQELGVLINKTANYIKYYADKLNLEITSNTKIALAMEGSLDAIICILAILKLGAAYVPLDTAAPKNRVNYICDNAEVLFVLVKEGEENNYAQRTISFNRYSSTYISMSGKFSGAIYHPEHLAYIIYTSGSTGVPKGVKVTLQNILRLIRVAQPLFSNHDNHKWSLFHSLAFDISVWEIFYPLVTGGEVCIVPASYKTNFKLLTKLFIEENINCLNITPSVFQAFYEYSVSNRLVYPALKYIVFAGENINLKTILAWYDYHGNNPFLINMFGATELTVHMTYCCLNKKMIEQATHSPIGKPLADFKAYVLNEQLMQVANLQYGILYVSGPGVAQGYQNNEDQTNRSFLPNPYKESHSKEHDILYKTGDLVYQDQQGDLFYVKRNDNQVKIRGFRVELNEIILALLKHPEISNAYCCVDEVNNEKQISAYIATRKIIDSQEVIDYLLSHLPLYMIPQHIYYVEEFKTNLNGKIDVSSIKNEAKLLLKHNIESFQTTDYVETITTQFWKEELKIDFISIKDHFLALGGTSLNVLHLISRINDKFSLAIAFNDIIKNPTIEKLSAHIKQLLGSSVGEVIDEEIVVNPLALTDQQKALVYVQEVIPKEIPIYNVFAIIKIQGSIDTNKLKKSVEMAAADFILLSAYLSHIGCEVLTCSTDPIYCSVQYVNEESVVACIKEVIKIPINLGNQSLCRFDLLQVKNDSHVLVINVNHLIFDGWSNKILLTRISNYYRDIVNHPLIKSKKIEKINKTKMTIDDWENYLHGLQCVNFTIYKDPPKNFSYHGQLLVKKLSEDTTNKIVNFCKENKITIFNFLISVYAMLIHKYSQKSSFCIGVPISLRNNLELLNEIGYHVNTLPVKYNVTHDSDVISVINNTLQSLDFVYSHLHTSVADLTKFITHDGFNKNYPLFQITFNENYNHVEDFKLDQCEIEFLKYSNGTAKFLQSLNYVVDKNIIFELEYSAQHFSEIGAQQFIDHFQNLIEVCINNPSEKINNMNFWTKYGYASLQTYSKINEKKPFINLIQGFLAQVDKNPNAIAIYHNNNSTTYVELNDVSDRIASKLTQCYDVREKIICMDLAQGVEFIVCILAVLKCGCIYVPLNKDDPILRKLQIIKDADPKVVISSDDILSSYLVNIPVLDINSLLSNQAEKTKKIEYYNNNACQILYTSGSTGKPKGVVISHAGILNMIEHKNFGLSSIGAIAQIGNLAFNASNFEIWNSMINGIPLVICEKSTLVNYTEFKKFIVDNNIKVLLITTALLQVYVDMDPSIFSTLRYLFFGGEKCNPYVIKKLYAYLKPMGCKLIQLYGSTELSCFSHYYVINDETLKLDQIPIGQGSNCVYQYILDKEFNMVPQGVIGEMYIGGDSLAMGYHKNETLQKEKFIIDTFAEKPRKIYKTGDLVKYNQYGDVEYWSRIDDAIKNRGFFVELGEIEASLRKHNAVESCLVKQLDIQNQKKLIVVVVPKNNSLEKKYLSDELQEYLVDRLPPFMLPDKVIVMHKIPLTRNGKVDFEVIIQSINETIHIQNNVDDAIQSDLVHIWQAYIPHANIDDSANFFNSGGNSILTIKLAQSISSHFKINFTSREVFENQSLLSQINLIRRELEKQSCNNHFSSLQPAVCQAAHFKKTSEIQKQLWLACQVHQKKSLFNVVVQYDLVGKLDLYILEKAWNQLLNDHVILRSCYFYVNNDLEMKIHPYNYYPIRGHDVNEFGSIAFENYIHQLVNQEFSLESYPLFSFDVFKIDNDHNKIVVVAHHIIADGKSMTILMQKLSYMYSKKLEGDNTVFDINRYDYRSFITWENQLLNSDLYVTCVKYWKEKLSGYNNEIALPFACSLLKKDSQGHTYTKNFPVNIFDSLNTYCLSQKITLANLFLSALFILVQKYTAERDIVIGITCENRLKSEFNDIVGDFANVIPVRCVIEPGMNINNLHTELMQLIAMAIECQYVPFSKILELSDFSSKSGSNPLVQILFSYYDFNDGQLFFNDIKYQRIFSFTDTSKYDLTFLFIKDGENISLNIEYLSCKYHVEDIALVAEHFLNLLSDICNSTIVKTVSCYQSLTESEKFNHVKLHNTNLCESNFYSPIYRIFEESASKFSTHIAIVDKKYYTYQALNDFSNKLAHYLVANNLHNQKIVAFFLERSFVATALTLAILKVRSIFIPLSTQLPVNTIKRVLEDSKVNAIITLNEYKDLFSSINFQPLVIDDSCFLNDIDHFPSHNLKIEAHESDLAYIIYTSGTTGVPKGIAIEHGAFTNSILAIGNKLAINSSDIILALSALSFDLSLFDYFVPLCFGGQVVIANDAIKQDPFELARAITSYRISCMAATPDLWRCLCLAGLPDSANFKIINAGEAITSDLVEKLLTKGTIYNFYGPTEATIFASCAIITNASDVYIGEPLTGYSFYILDDHMQPQNSEIPGMLYIGGIGLARGYHNNLSLTEASFIYLENSNQKIRLYKTNDIVVMTKNGSIRYIGRKDNQIKYQGYRIELSGVETVLNQHPDIEKSIVHLAKNEDQTPKLIAFCILKTDRFNQDDIVTYLSCYLPSYMIPNYYLKVDNFPLNVNGKIDKLSLLKLVPEIQIGKTTINYKNSIESKIAELWEFLLQVNNIAIDADFFKLGGNSILLIQFIMQLKHEFSVELPAYKIFQKPTIAAIAALIDKPSINQNIVINCDENNQFEEFPLSEIQRAYCLGRLSDFEIGNVATHLYVEFDFENISYERLQLSFNSLIRRHPMLRCVITINLMQKVLDNINHYEIILNDLSNQEAEEETLSLQQIRNAMSHHVNNFYQWPLFRAQLSKCRSFYRLHFSLDGIITDAQSFILLLHDWSALYQEKFDEINKIDLTYRDYIMAYERLLSTEQAINDKNYWLKKINEMPTRIKLPLKINPRNIKTPHFSRVKNIVSPADFDKLKQYCKLNNLEVSVVLLAVFSILLNYWSDEDNFLIKLTTLSRFFSHKDINNIFGDFTTLTLFEVNSSDIKTQSINDYFVIAQKLLLSNLSHNLYGAISVERDLIAKHKLDPCATLSPIIFSCFLLDYGIPKDELFGAKIINNYSISQTSQVWIDTKIYTEEGALILEWDYVDQLFDVETVEFMNLLYAELIKSISGLTGDEKCLNVLFESLELICPKPPSIGHSHAACLLNDFYNSSYQKNTAIVYDNVKITYDELMNLSYRLSTVLHPLLLKLKVDKVAVLLTKSHKQVVAVLGIINCNAAYVPLSTEWPLQRIIDVLNEHKITLLISDNITLKNFDSQALNKFTVVNYDQLRLEEFNVYPLNLAKLDSTAYIIFTSGSTGKPKGVMVTHRQAMNTISEINSLFNISYEDKILSLSALSFDLSVYDIFGTLAKAAAIIIPNEKNIKNPDYLIQLIRWEKISVLNLVPTFLQMLIEFIESLKEPIILPTVRLIMQSGDWIPIDVAKKIKFYFPNARLISLGGATEGGIWSIYYEIDKIKPHWLSIPYGKALSNQSVFIYNKDLLPVPYHFLGEIYLGGASITSGYLNQEAETVQKFINHPFTTQRIYKTGDIGFLYNDNNVILVGRNDFQVKIDGYRVELAEIESAIMLNKEVSACKVFAENQHGKLFIFSFIILKNNSKDLETFENSLKSDLLKILPHYMVPHYYNFIDCFPLTDNGKLDRKRLLDNIQVKFEDKNNIDLQEYSSERSLSLHWFDVLGVSVTSNQDNFFHMGGNSLSALRLVYLLNDLYHLNLPVSWVFQYENIYKQAMQLKNYNKTDLYWPLIKLNDAPTIPIVFVHPGNSGAEVYYPLAKLLNKNINFCVLDSYNLYSNENIISSIEGLAELYTDKLLTAYSSKTFILAGWSLGGVIAFEMAKLLQSSGYRVPTLCLLDSFNFNTTEKKLLYKNINNILGNLQLTQQFKLAPKKRQEKILKVANAVTEMLSNYCVTSIDSKIVIFKSLKKQLVEGVEFQNFLDELTQKEDNGWNNISNVLQIIGVDSCHQTILQVPSSIQKIADFINSIVD